MAVRRGERDLGAALAAKLELPPDAIHGWKILKRSLDARHRRPPHYDYTLQVELSPDIALPAGFQPFEAVEYRPVAPTLGHPNPPIVVGMGPAGLFAALRLTEYGLKPIVIERGQPVETRVRDVARYWKTGQVDTESNVQFGEGGAGAFSDGKLTSRSRDFRKRWVLEQLVAAGAGGRILIDAKPHIGTDRLRATAKALRAVLEQRGAELRYGERVERLLIENDRLAGVETSKGAVYGSPVFLGIGHSARETLKTLSDQGVQVEAKGFAIGVRAEVEQHALNLFQYGEWSEILPAAEFVLREKGPQGRGVYSFCMCPGGTVVPAASEPGHLVINGMSGHARSGKYANAALVVEVRPGDFDNDPFAGFELQRQLERRAEELAGVRSVPAQRVESFSDNAIESLGGNASNSLGGSACPWNLVECDLGRILPDFVTSALKEAMPAMISKLAPLARGTLLAVETRTSSPARISRGPDMQSVTMEGLYPVGEGAGYAGGIVSSAIDGVRAVDQFCSTIGGTLKEIMCG